MSYTVKIIDNDNGTVMMEKNTVKAIIGAVATDEGAEGVSFSSCNNMTRAGCIFTAQQVCDMTKKKTPQIALMLALFEAHKDELESVTVDLSPLKRKKNGD